MRLWVWIYLCWWVSCRWHVAQSSTKCNTMICNKKQVCFSPFSWSMSWWWRSLFAQVVCRINQEYINHISFQELWFHENSFFPERQYECWVQKMIRWGSWQYTLHVSITSVAHRQVNVLCSECGVFLVKCFVAVMSSLCGLYEFRCCQITSMVSDIETLLKFPCQCCVCCGELAKLRSFVVFPLGWSGQGWWKRGRDPLRSHILTCFSLHSQNTTNLNKFD